MVSNFFTIRHLSGRLFTTQVSSASPSSCPSSPYSISRSFLNEPWDGTARSCADKLRCMTSIPGGMWWGSWRRVHTRNSMAGGLGRCRPQGSRTQALRSGGLWMRCRHF